MTSYTEILTDVTKTASAGSPSTASTGATL